MMRVLGCMRHGMLHRLSGCVVACCAALASVALADLDAEPNAFAYPPNVFLNQPLESTTRPVFQSLRNHQGEAETPAGISNYRLFLRYSATPAARATVLLAGRNRLLIPGENRTIEYAVEQSGDGPIVVREWRNDRAKPDSWECPLPEVPDRVKFGEFAGQSVPAKLKTGAGFTLHDAWIQPLSIADHRAILESPLEDALRKGEGVYRNTCQACHGSPGNDGLQPGAPRFDRDALAGGSDAWSIWRAIRFGHGTMAAEPSLTTVQGYAVARFIQEQMIRPGRPGGPEFPAEPASNWLGLLPRGMTQIGEAADDQLPPPWELMDFGPWLFQPMTVGRRADHTPDVISKSLSIRLDHGPGGITRGRAWVVYDLETMRLAAFAEGGKLHDNHHASLDGSPNAQPTLTADKQWIGPPGAGWANPEDGTWDVPLLEAAVDGEPGSERRKWIHFRGLRVHGQSVAIAYTVGDTEILEHPEWEDARSYNRHFHIGPSTRALRLRTGTESSLLIKPEQTPGLLSVNFRDNIAGAIRWNEGIDPANFTTPGPARFPIEYETHIEAGPDDIPFAIDRLTHPAGIDQPGASWMRFTGFDFFAGGDAAALCTANGDVWIVRGFNAPGTALYWRRYASGLSRPSAVKVIKGSIHVRCADQTVRLGDTNKDGNADFLECVEYSWEANSPNPFDWIPREFAPSLQPSIKVPRSAGWTGLAGHELSPAGDGSAVFALLKNEDPGAEPRLAWKLPITPLPTGVSAARFRNKCLYFCGNLMHTANPRGEGGFFRIRPTNKSHLQPVEFSATTQTIALRFSSPLDPLKSVDPRSYRLQASKSTEATEASGDSRLSIRRLAMRDDQVILQAQGLEPGGCATLACRMRDRAGAFYPVELAYSLPAQLEEPTPEETKMVEEHPLLPPDTPVPDPPPGQERLPELDDPVEEEEPLPRK